MLVERGKLDKRNFGVYSLPAVESDNDAMHGKEQVVIRLLEGLGYGVKLAFVGAGVVALSLARHGTDKVTMHPHSKAYHIDSLLYVGFPVAALLIVIYLVDDNIVLLFAVGCNIESRKPGFAAVLGACEEVENLLFLGDDTRLLLSAVGNALGTENTLPVFCADLDVVFYGSGVFELRFFGDADKLLDVVPLAAEQRAIIRNGIISAVDGRDSRHDGKLAAAGVLGEFVLQIAPRRSRVEQVDFLDVAPRRDRLSPVGVKDFGNATVSVGGREAAITGFLSQQAHDACAVLVENKHGHGEAEVLEALTDDEEVCGEIVVK